MAERSDRPTTTARIYKDVAQRVRLVAVATGTNAADLLDRIVSPALDEMVRQHVPARFRSTRRPARYRQQS
jgi:hypothetical protein